MSTDSLKDYSVPNFKGMYVFNFYCKTTVKVAISWGWLCGEVGEVAFWDPGIPCGIASNPSCSTYSPAPCYCLGESSRASRPRAVVPMWKTWTTPAAPAFGLAPSWSLSTFGEWTTGPKISLCLSLCLCNSAIQIKHPFQKVLQWPQIQALTDNLHIFC